MFMWNNPTEMDRGLDRKQTTSSHWQRSQIAVSLAVFRKKCLRSSLLLERRIWRTFSLRLK